MAYYALYKGEQILSHGTRKEIAERMEISVAHVNVLASRTNRGLQKEGHMKLIKVEDDK